MLGKIEGVRRRGWDGGMASLTQWTWVWANSKRQWRTRKPGILQSQFSSVAQSCPTLCDSWAAVRQAFLSFTISWSLLRFMSIESVMLANRLILCHPLLPLLWIFPNLRVFSIESALRIRWPQYWSFRISPSNEYSRLISFRIDWFDILAVYRTLKSLLQHNSKASILQCSDFFMIQLSHIHTWLPEKP